VTRSVCQWLETSKDFQGRQTHPACMDRYDIRGGETRLLRRPPASVLVLNVGNSTGRPVLPHFAVFAEQHDVLPSRSELLHGSDLVHLRQYSRFQGRLALVELARRGETGSGGLQFTPGDDFAGQGQCVEGPSSCSERGRWFGQPDPSRYGQSSADKATAESVRDPGRSGPSLGRDSEPPVLVRLRVGCVSRLWHSWVARVPGAADSTPHTSADDDASCV
jgi:hypothetical protein